MLGRVLERIIGLVEIALLMGDLLAEIRSEAVDIHASP